MQPTVGENDHFHEIYCFRRNMFSSTIASTSKYSQTQFKKYPKLASKPNIFLQNLLC